MMKKCHDCGVAITCKTRCLFCLEKAKTRQRERRGMRLSNGICNKCGIDTDFGR